MPREKREATYTQQLADAIKEAGISVEEAAQWIGVKADTLDGWLYVERRPEVPKWAYDLFILHTKDRQR